jgi:hypothetical protein
MKKVLLLIFAMLMPLPSQAGVIFETGSYELLPESQASLDKLGKQLARALKKTPAMIIYVKGHTDNVGKHFENKMLSWNRADTVREYLEDNFNIPSEKFKISGCGPDEPVATNDTAEGRSRNRRVEVIFGENKVILSGDPVHRDVPLYPPSRIWVKNDGYAFPGEPITVFWEGGSHSNYLVKISSDMNFSHVVVSSETSRRNAEAQLDSEMYWARVACLADGKMRSRFSQPYQFTIKRKKIIQELNLLAASKGGRISTLKSRYGIHGKIAGGAKLMINGKDVELKDDASFSDDMDLSEGENTVTVKGVVPGTNYSEEMRFTINYSAVRMGFMLQSGLGLQLGDLNDSYRYGTSSAQFGIVVSNISRFDVFLSGAMYRLAVKSSAQRLKSSGFGSFLGTQYRFADKNSAITPYLGFKLGFMELPDKEQYSTKIYPGGGICCGTKYPLNKAMNFTFNLDYLYRADAKSLAMLSIGLEVY